MTRIKKLEKVIKDFKEGLELCNFPFTKKQKIEAVMREAYKRHDILCIDEQEYQIIKNSF